MTIKNVDEKHVVVPREPTAKMIEAAAELWNGRYVGLETFLRQQWAAMIARADEGVER